jgi:hypothetical protein
VAAEVQYAWMNSYSPAATRQALDSMANEPAAYKISHLVSRLFFRGIYFPQKGAWKWLKLIVENRSSVWRIVRDSFTHWHGIHDRDRTEDLYRSSRSAAQAGPLEPEMRTEFCNLQLATYNLQLMAGREAELEISPIPPRSNPQTPPAGEQ